SSATNAVPRGALSQHRPDRSGRLEDATMDAVKGITFDICRANARDVADATISGSRMRLRDAVAKRCLAINSPNAKGGAGTGAGLNENMIETTLTLVT